jgi:hypothetical protein
MVKLSEKLFTGFWIVGCIVLLTLGILNSQGITQFGKSDNADNSNISGYTIGLLAGGIVFGVFSIIVGGILWAQIKEEREKSQGLTIMK